MPVLPLVDASALSDAISRGVVAGTAKVIDSLAAAADRRHALADIVQTNVDKVWELDGELKLIKGMLASLIGANADGSSGMVPRMENDMTELRKDVAEVKAEVHGLKRDIGSIKESLSSIIAKQSTSSSFMDGWKGVGVFVGMMFTCVSLITGIVTAIIWMVKHL